MEASVDSPPEKNARKVYDCLQIHEIRELSFTDRSQYTVNKWVSLP